MGFSEIDGKRELVYARWNVPRDKVQHESEITEFLLKIKPEKVTRGWESDSFQSDAEMVIAACQYRMEWDRGTMGYKDVLDRMKKYEDCEDLVLWVCSSRTRLEGLMRRAAKLCAKIPNLKEIFLFATRSDVMQKLDTEPIWTDLNGHTAALRGD